MSDATFDDLLQKAKSHKTPLNDLMKIVECGDEALCSAVALNPNCNWYLLKFLASLNLEGVNKKLSARYKTCPALYSLSVREIGIEDAGYVLGLRLDETYSRFISKISGDVTGQERYIQKYIDDNLLCRDSFYFILKNADTGMRCGTVRIYNFKNGTFEWGSWILDENKPRYAAMETAVFVYEFAFNVLGFDQSEFEVNRGNERVVAFHKKSGAEIIEEDEINFYFRIDKKKGLTFAQSLRDRLDSK